MTSIHSNHTLLAFIETMWNSDRIDPSEYDNLVTALCEVFMADVVITGYYIENVDIVLANGHVTDRAMNLVLACGVINENERTWLRSIDPKQANGILLARLWTHLGAT